MNRSLFAAVEREIDRCRFRVITFTVITPTPVTAESSHPGTAALPAKQNVSRLSFSLGGHLDQPNCPRPALRGLFCARSWATQPDRDTQIICSRHAFFPEYYSSHPYREATLLFHSGVPAVCRIAPQIRIATSPRPCLSNTGTLRQYGVTLRG